MKIKDSRFPQKLPNDSWAYRNKKSIEVYIGNGNGNPAYTKITLGKLKKWISTLEKEGV